MLLASGLGPLAALLEKGEAALAVAPGGEAGETVVARLKTGAPP